MIGRISSRIFMTILAMWHFRQAREDDSADSLTSGQSVRICRFNGSFQRCLSALSSF